MRRRTSARVGVGLVIMLSSMLVATMTGLPRRRQPCTMRDCQKGTCTDTIKEAEFGTAKARPQSACRCISSTSSAARRSSRATTTPADSISEKVTCKVSISAIFRIR